MDGERRIVGQILGDMYLDGIHVPKNLRRAAEWLKIAADENDSDAKWKLAVLYHTEAKLGRSTREVVALLTEAADAGHREAASFLQDIREDFRRGLRLELDPVMYAINQDRVRYAHFIN